MNRCFPSTEADSAKIATTFDDQIPSREKRVRVDLRSEDRNAPTRSRWQSFGWVVFTCPLLCKPQRGAEMSHGLLAHHTSTVRPSTEITVERGSHGPYFVRIRTAECVTYQERWETETRARDRFEKVVVLHENGETQ